MTKTKCSYCKIVIKSEDNVDSLTCAKCGREYMLDQVENKVTGEVEPKWVCVKRATKINQGNAATFTPAGLREWSKPEVVSSMGFVCKAKDWIVVQDMSKLYARGVIALDSASMGRRILVRKHHVRVRDPKLFWRTDAA
jgi:predicted RNA-binding Zn-ribbon protein involved in translation (DUF1610 family)